MNAGGVPNTCKSSEKGLRAELRICPTVRNIFEKLEVIPHESFLEKDVFYVVAVG
jgi:hypothetical protein